MPKLRSKVTDQASNNQSRRNGRRAAGRRARFEADGLEGAIVGLAIAGKLSGAGHSAVRAQREAGLPVTYRRGNEIIKEFPDGREEVLGVVQAPVYKLPKGVKRIRRE